MFKVGDGACRIDRDLDTRPVSAVRGEGEHQEIKLQIGTVETEWLPASLYDCIPTP